MRLLVSSLLLLALAAFVGCTQQGDSGSSEAPGDVSVSTFNDQCPIMGGDVTADGGTTQWDGKTIGFCCPGCIDKFEALSDDEKAAALAKAEDGHGDHDHGDHDHGDHDHGDHDHEEHESTEAS